jgi:hypothetical protein
VRDARRYWPPAVDLSGGNPHVTTAHGASGSLTGVHPGKASREGKTASINNEVMECYSPGRVPGMTTRGPDDPSQWRPRAPSSRQSRDSSRPSTPASARRTTAAGHRDRYGARALHPDIEAGCRYRHYTTRPLPKPGRVRERHGGRYRPTTGADLRNLYA